MIINKRLGGAGRGMRGQGVRGARGRRGVRAFRGLREGANRHEVGHSDGVG